MESRPKLQLHLSAKDIRLDFDQPHSNNSMCLFESGGTPLLSRVEFELVIGVWHVPWSTIRPELHSRYNRFECVITEADDGRKWLKKLLQSEPAPKALDVLTLKACAGSDEGGTD